MSSATGLLPWNPKKTREQRARVMQTPVFKGAAEWHLRSFSEAQMHASTTVEQPMSVCSRIFMRPFLGHIRFAPGCLPSKPASVAFSQII